jgi:predicted transcriptional regulator
LTSLPTSECDVGINDFKTLILNHIRKSPGTRYRELLRLSGLTNGALEYHLKILEKTQQIMVDRQNGRRPRYFPLDMEAEEARIMGHIRNKSSRQIVLFILEHNLCTFGEILEYMKKAPSTISWHLKRLVEIDVISIIHGQELQLYKISNTKLVSSVLSKYKDNLSDKVADEYYEMFGQI